MEVCLSVVSSDTKFAVPSPAVSGHVGAAARLAGFDDRTARTLQRHHSWSAPRRSSAAPLPDRREAPPCHANQGGSKRRALGVAPGFCRESLRWRRGDGHGGIRAVQEGNAVARSAIGSAVASGMGVSRAAMAGVGPDPIASQDSGESPYRLSIVGTRARRLEPTTARTRRCRSTVWPCCVRHSCRHQCRALLPMARIR